MAPLEVIALILALATLIKIIFLFTNPKAWLKFANSIYSSPAVTMTVMLALAVVVGYYLLWELSIVQIFAAAAFVVLLMGTAFMAYSKEMMALASSVLKKKDAIKRAWLSILIWTILSLWVLWEIFM